MKTAGKAKVRGPGRAGKVVKASAGASKKAPKTAPKNTVRPLWQRIRPVLIRLTPWFKTFIVVFLFGMVFVLSAYIQPRNGGGVSANYVSPPDLAIPIAVAVLTALITSIAYTLTFRGSRRLALLASLIMVLFSSSFENRFLAAQSAVKFLSPFELGEQWAYSLIFYLFLLVFSALIAYWLLKFLGRWKQVGDQIITLLTVAVLFMFTVNAWQAAVYLRQTNAQLSYRAPSLATSVPAAAQGADKPDIYYIVLDRYTNNQNLKADLGFDNSPFLDGLRSEGFSINDSAYATYPYTAVSIGATMKAGFLDDMEKQFGNDKEQSQIALFNLSRYSQVAQELKKVGYRYDAIGSWFGATNKSQVADRFYYDFARLDAFGHSKVLSEFDAKMLGISPYAETLMAGVKVPVLNLSLPVYHTQDSLQLTQYQLSTLKTMSEDEPGGRFIFAHILVPHDPFVFNADGSVNTGNVEPNNYSKPVKQKYTDQIQYINGEMNKLFSTILQRSNGKAVIVLQADEGFYPQVILGEDFDVGRVGYQIEADDMRTWSDQYLRGKYGVLAAYHLPGVSNEELAAGGDSTNIFRLVLNHYFGYQLSYLPKCHFAYDKGRAKAFSFTDITSRLQTQAAPDTACSTVHD